jgi:hypothetical protein
VATVSSPELIQYASSLAREPFGPAGARAVGEAYDEHAVGRKRLLAPVAWWVDGRDVPSLFAALTDPRLEGTSGEIRLGGPVSGGPAWEFLVPFRKVLLHEDGGADLFPGDGGPPHRTIARFLLRDRLPLDGSHPLTAVARTAAPLDAFGTFAETIALCRSAPVLPFGLALLLYLPAERIRCEVDLVQNYVLSDPRAGRLSAARRVRRTARFSWGLDRLIGRGRLSPLGARSLELLAETHGLTSVEIAQVLGGPRELVDAALRTVVERGFATLDPRTARYHAVVETFLPQPVPAQSTPSASADPSLRTSVQELLAAAEEKATCPLCGGPIGAGARDKLLCDNCAKAVGLP